MTPHTALRRLTIIITICCWGLAVLGQTDADTLRVDDMAATADTVAQAAAPAAVTVTRTDTIDIAMRLREDSIAQAVRDITDSLMGVSPVVKPRKRFIPDSKRALWLGLVFPGGGQIYNRKYWKLPILYGGFLGCLYALNWNGQMYSDYRQAYLDIMDSNPATASYMDMLPIGYDITGKEPRFKEIFKRKKDYYRHYRDMSIFAMIAVWALGVIDAYVDAELSTFDISPDLSIQVTPTIFQTGDMVAPSSAFNAGVGVSVRF